MSMLRSLGVLKCSDCSDTVHQGATVSEEASMRRLGVGFASVLFGFWLAGSALAQDPRQNEPGKFDFYVLALSWSPSFCEQAGERKSAQQQCGERPFSF